MDIICWIKGLFSSVKVSAKNKELILVSGHEGKVTEIHDNVTVVIRECTCCGKQEILWGRGASIEKIKEHHCDIEVQR